MIKYLDTLKNEGIKSENIAIGFFDGVHKGHIKLLEKLKKDDLIITFSLENKEDEIYDLEIKINKLCQFCDNIIVLDLLKIKDNSAKDFIDFLNSFEPSNIIVGTDFKFGNEQDGDVELLKEYFNIDLIELEKKDSLKISSSLIRSLLKNGEVKEANEILGEKYYFIGKVIECNKNGRTIGFPTANLDSEIKILKKGVYKTCTTIDGVVYDSITNVGNRPTFNGNNVIMETHVLNFNRHIYGEIIKVEILDFLRDEIKFNSVQELKEQIVKDIENIQKGE